MKRLDAISNWLFEAANKAGEVFLMKNVSDRSRYLIVFRPANEHTLYFGKMTIPVDRLPTESEVEKLCKNEIKLRLQDKGWYSNGLRRLLIRIKNGDEHVYN